MWKLPVPDCGNVAEELDVALTYANGRRKYRYTDSQKGRLLETYARYDALRGQPDESLLARRLGRKFLNALSDAYGEVQEGGRLSALRDRLRYSTQKCPYCGFGEVRDLDHQLPKSRYKALAIYPVNLIPCCHPCNNKKRAVTGEDPDCQFPHPYLTDLPLEQFLYAYVDVDASGLLVRFAIERCGGMSEAAFRQLSFHLQRMDLQTRYQAEVSTFMTSQRTAIEYAAESGVEGLRRFLSRSISNSKRDFGMNHWQTALLVGLLASDDFCEGGYRFCFGVRGVGV